MIASVSGGLVVAVVVALLLVVSSSGSVRVWSEPPPGAPATVIEEGTAPDDDLGTGQGRLPAQEAGTPDSWWLRVLAIALGLALLRWAWIVISFWWHALRGRRERVPRFGGGLDALPGTNGDDEVTVDFDLDDRLDRLRTGDPRNAIVACWSQLEDDAAAAGLGRMPSETSMEYTQRVLSAAAVDVEAIEELAELYREARFSDHPVDDDRRARAVAALRRLHGSLHAHRATRLHESGSVG